MSKRASAATYYKKGQGEIQFTFLPPRWEKKEGSDVEYVSREGAILVEAARALEGSEKSNWVNKVSFGLGYNDFGQILIGLRSVVQSVKLLHKHPADGHVSRFEVSKGEREGTYRFTVSGRGAAGEDNFVSIFLNTADISTFLQLIEFAIPRILGWNQAQN